MNDPVEQNDQVSKLETTRREQNKSTSAMSGELKSVEKPSSNQMDNQ